MEKPDYILAIDPDTDKSGVAILNIKTKEVHLESMEFPNLIEFLRTVDNLYPNLQVIVEAGWLNASHWHLKKGETTRMAATKGNAVGRNHETARLIAHMARFYKCNVQEVKPLKKHWKGKDGKITHEELAYFVPGLPPRTNQETRDATLLAIYYAGCPIKVNYRKLN